MILFGFDWLIDMTTGAWLLVSKITVIQECKERLQTSEEEKQHLVQTLEIKQKMEHARDAQISNLKTTQELQEKGTTMHVCYWTQTFWFTTQIIICRLPWVSESYLSRKAMLAISFGTKTKLERAKDAEISSLKASNKQPGFHIASSPGCINS